MRLAIAFGSIGLGFLLLILSGLWVSMFPGTAAWTLDKNARYSQVKDRMHNLGFMLNDTKARSSMHAGPERGTAKQEFDELKKEYDQLSSEFQSAHDNPRTAAKILKWTGIAFAGIGIFFWYAFKDA